MTARLDVAVAYGGAGWPVLPLHTIRSGHCTCGKPACDHPGKHPDGGLAPHGKDDATTDRATIERWWRRRPAANIGVRTGAESHIVVLDVDPRHGGDASLAALEAEHGGLPRTPTVETGGGGRHYYFQHPGGVVRCKSGLRPGLDVKADGGSIVVPPSDHVSGRPYRWLVRPKDASCAPLPAWLLALMGEPAPGASLNGAGGTDRLTEGGRNAALASLAGTMRKRGMTPEAITAALLEENGARCDPPLAEREVRAIAASIARYPPPTPRGAGRAASGNPWAAAQAAPDFLAGDDADLDFLEPGMLAPGSVTELFSPRGIGKTHYAHAVAVKLAKAGKRVLLLDRDNSRREVRRRLREWGAGEAPTLKVLTRDQTPPLTDAAAWAAFPFTDYDVVIIDALDSSAEGVGEQSSEKPSQALAPILDIAHREAGPAILLLGTTTRDGAHSRGSGVVEDRADIVYEVRDATDLKPTGTKPWIEELPPADAGSWATRATRRQRRDTYRLAFVPTKFRVGEEPDPFIVEINLTGEPWTIRDVTDDVDQAGAAERQRREDEHRRRVEAATAALVAAVAQAGAAGAPMRKGDAERLLIEQGLTRDPARRLLEEQNGVRWRVVERSGEPGHPKAVLPLDAEGVRSEGRGTPLPPQTHAGSGLPHADFGGPHLARAAELDAPNPASGASRGEGAISAAVRTDAQAAGLEERFE